MSQTIEERNQQNAQHSTGPRTPAGQARSSQNSLRHGMYAKCALLPTEDPAEYHEYLKQGMADLKPTGFTQTEIAQMMVDNYWRLRAAHRQHNSQMMKQLKELQREAPAQTTESGFVPQPAESPASGTPEPPEISPCIPDNPPALLKFPPAPLPPVDSAPEQEAA